MSLDFNRTIDLTKFLPAVTDQCNDIIKALESENIDVNAIWSDLCTLFNDQFIGYASNYGLTQWESILGLVPKYTDSLDDRRFRIFTFLKGNRPYTYEKLCKLLDYLCGKGGYTIALDTNAYSIIIKLNLGVKSQLTSAMEMLERLVPKNLLLTVGLNYNRHMDIKAVYTHQQCAMHTHQSLREDVLE